MPFVSDQVSVDSQKTPSGRPVDSKVLGNPIATAPGRCQDRQTTPPSRTPSRWPVTSQRVPARQVRAWYDEHTITLYQAYSVEITERALTAGTFVAPFKLDRITWIKPSFLWMMYRSGWATKPGQERVLAIAITRDGFEWALAHSCLSHYEPDTHASRAAWAEQQRDCPVRVQWDPERSLRLGPLDHRTIQIGLSGKAARRYVSQWIVQLRDLTSLAREAGALVARGDLATAQAIRPAERPYQLPAPLRRQIGITRNDQQE
jgi:hypothetical protein